MLRPGAARRRDVFRSLEGAVLHGCILDGAVLDRRRRRRPKPAAPAAARSSAADRSRAAAFHDCSFLQGASFRGAIVPRRPPCIKTEPHRRFPSPTPISDESRLPRLHRSRTSTSAASASSASRLMESDLRTVVFEGTVLRHHDPPQEQPCRARPARSLSFASSQLMNADLTGCDFSGCDLRATNFKDSQAHRGEARPARSASNALFIGATVTEASFADAEPSPGALRRRARLLPPISPARSSAKPASSAPPWTLAKFNRRRSHLRGSSRTPTCAARISAEPRSSAPVCTRRARVGARFDTVEFARARGDDVRSRRR